MSICQYIFFLPLVFYGFYGCKSENALESKPFKTEINKKVVLKPGSDEGKDASINIIIPTSNRGDSDVLALFTWTALSESMIVRSFVGFNLLDISEESRIDSVFLNLYLIRNSETDYTFYGNSGNNSFFVQRIIEPWNEHQVNWVNQPLSTKRNVVLVEKVDTLSYGLMRIDVTNLVKDSVNNLFPEFGFCLRLKNEEKYTRVFFASSDYGDSTKHPELEIYYSEYE